MSSRLAAGLKCRSSRAASTRSSQASSPSSARALSASVDVVQRPATANRSTPFDMEYLVHPGVFLHGIAPRKAIEQDVEGSGLHRQDPAAVRPAFEPAAA